MPFRLWDFRREQIETTHFSSLRSVIQEERIPGVYPAHNVPLQGTDYGPLSHVVSSSQA